MKTYVCMKDNTKVTTLTTIRRYININKTRFLFNMFFESQFQYRPLTWMSCCGTTNNRINELHERALLLVYNDHDLPFYDLLEKDGSSTILRLLR